MEFYIFRSVNKQYAVPFRLFVVNQNLKVTRFSSMLIIMICVLVLISSFFFQYIYLPENKNYLYGVLFFLTASIVYYSLISYLKRLPTRRRLVIKRIVSSSYPLIIISGMMWISFVADRSPANNMTMFMFGMIYVAVSWLFSLMGAATISVLSYTLICIGLMLFRVSSPDIMLDYISGGIIVVGFYIISRFLYSYHANYFIQLKQIERNNHEIRKIDQLKTEMLGIVAHDLRSPINSITALTELAAGSNSNEERNEYYKLMQDACDEAKNIIVDLITTVKGESNQSLKLREINLNLFLSQIQQNWSHKMTDGKEVLLTIPDRIIHIYIDEDKMHRVFDNLIGNALKFTDCDGRIRIKLDTNEDEQATIKISDNGIGIPEDMIPFLFQRFSKAGRLGLNGEKSHGLGLNICKQIVEQHNGKINVSSVVDEGTDFTICLPLKEYDN